MIATLLPYPFDQNFMTRALVAALIVGTSAPLIGTFVVQRKLSLVGDGLGHVAAAGVGIALWLGIAPQPVAIVATIVAACAIEWIFHASKSADTALAVIFYSGIAASITFAGRSSRQSQLQQFLFGSLLTATWDDVLVIGCVCTVVSIIIIALWRLLLTIAIDESSAKIAGIPTHVLHVVLMCAVALIVSVSMTITGLLLISAVMVVPVMTSRLFSRTFRSAWINSSLLGALGSVVGLGTSRVLNIAPGGTIVLTHIAIFILVGIVYSLIHRSSGRSKNNSHVHS